jgi:Ran GTPase-activating protein (RanGAP) involved in mRNA processing and transport
LFGDDGTSAGKAISDMLAANSTLKELNVSSNAKYGTASKGGPSFAQAISGIRDNGALSVLSLKSNSLCAEGGKALAAGLKGNQGITELDISDNSLGMNSVYDADTSGIIALADAIPDMRALSVLSLKSNSLQAAGGKALAEGLKGNQVITELDISSNNLGLNSDYGADTSGIIALADVIPDMGALSVLSLKSNGLGVGSGKALAEGLKGNQVITELNIADNNLANYGADMSGVVALADVIPDMGALMSLNLSSNLLKAQGAIIIADAIKVSKCATAVVLAPFSCPSDHWWNCCCLLLSTGQYAVDQARSQQQCNQSELSRREVSSASAWPAALSSLSKQRTRRIDIHRTP